LNRAIDNLSSRGERILKLLGDNLPRTAREIAKQIDGTRKEINTCLRGELRGQVYQSADYKWSVGTGDPSSSTPKPDAHLLAKLSSYYLECLSVDQDSGYSFFAESRYQPDYSEIPELEVDDASVRFAVSVDGSSLINSADRGRFRKQVYFGYPIRIRQHNARSGWQGYFVEPIFIFSVNNADRNATVISLGDQDFPSINPAVVRSFSDEGGSTLMGEIAELSEELGLGTISQGIPPLDEMIDRLKTSRQIWDWKEDIDPNTLSSGSSIAKLREQGIYNRAVLFAAEKSPYTQGLETELNALRNVDKDVYESTALRNWLVDDFDEPDEDVSDTPLIEILPLNSEQRAAVQSAMSKEVTVITGPPGTGKSQVVSAIISNAAWKGQRVLFASKNNKAVDVVEARVNSLGPRPVLMRTGANQNQEKLAAHIDFLLSATSTIDDEHRYSEAKRVLDRMESEELRLSRHVKSLVDLRNHVDQLDLLVEGISTYRPDDFSGLSGDNAITTLRSEVAKMRMTLAECDPKKIGIINRLFFYFSRSRREAAARRIIDAVLISRTVPGCPAPQTDFSLDFLNDWVEWVDELASAVDDMETIRDLRRAVTELGDVRPFEAVASDRTELSEQKADISGDLWDSWLRLQTSRLDRPQRQAMADFVTALRLLMAAQNSDEKPSGNLYRRLQELYPQVTRIMNCWAVTSLAAHRRIPFEPGFFDLVVFDEASQCDIASALPLIYRAKRVVIIGDPMQLTHISKISEAQDNQLLSRYELIDRPRFSYSANSLFGLGSAVAPSAQLVDHHRSHADIIGFSNEHFYRGDLRVATKYDQLKSPSRSEPAVRWVDVGGRTRRPGGSAVNDIEAEAVVAELRRLLLDQQYQGSVGVVTPFKAQAQSIRDMAYRDSKLADLLNRAGFESDTADGFQGDEKDVILFSPVAAPGITDGATRFLNRERNRFNVAITRARAALVIVGDRTMARTGGIEYLTNLSDYVDNLGTSHSDLIQTPADQGAEFPSNVSQENVSEWEIIFYRALYSQGIKTQPQWPVEQYRLDLALFSEDRKRRLDIEVDGERYHREWNGELARRDQIRNQRVIELGWDVQRFWVYEIRDHMSDCIERVESWIEGTYSPETRLLR
jgi:very-short-patch-repair endonuclease